MSTERDNLLLATLSAGIVGIGDPLGAEDAANLRRVMRADAVLVKPDAPLVPTDESLLAEAASSAGAQPPMVAATFSDHGDMHGLYVFAYARDGAAQIASFAPSALGLAGAAYVYDVFGDTGRRLAPGERFSSSVSTGSYFVVAPVGPSGIAFLGDQEKFVSLGQKRISQLADDGTLRASIEFASGEQAIRLHGYAQAMPTVSLSGDAGGSVDGLTYDPATQLFSFELRADSAPSTVTLALSAIPAAP